MPTVLSVLRWLIIVLLYAGVIAVGVKLDKPAARDGVEPVRNTAQYALSVRAYRDLVAPPGADGGAIESIRAGFLLAEGDGVFYWITRHKETDELIAAPLRTTPPPFDRAAFLADFESANGVYRLRLTDILFDAAGARLFAAHQFWRSAERCFTMRVSVIDVKWTPAGAPVTVGGWRPVFESQPCIGAGTPFDDSETGGKLALMQDGVLLLTLGDHGYAGLDGRTPFAQDALSDYGKILAIDPATGGRSIFSRGHRNPQGLTVARDGRIWSSEHGPQGGDEINLIVEGRNYGWPYVTYGTNYGGRILSLNPDGLNHAAYQEPATAFVPSVAASALIEINGAQFPRWEGDLLLASLRGKSLYRSRVSGDRIIYTEWIGFGERIRDLAQDDQGRIVLWSDNGVVSEITRATTDSAYQQFCAACHEPVFGPAAGPPIRDVVGRRIASSPGFAYSPALQGKGGVWTEENLDEFLRDPEAFAPGTTMRLSGLDDRSRAEVTAELASHARSSE